MIPTSNRIAIIGDEDLICGLKIFGFDTFFVKKKDSEREMFKEILEKRYPVCLIQEIYFSKLRDLVSEIKERLFPLILPIPDHRGIKGLAKGLMREAALKAVGADILK